MSKRGGDLISEAPRIWMIMKTVKIRIRLMMVGERWVRWDLENSVLRFFRKMRQRMNTIVRGIKTSAKL